MGPPAVTKDARFRAARKLIQSGQLEDNAAVNMLATLLEQARATHGDTSIDAAACYYEYGNVLFRVENRRKLKQEEQEEDDAKQDMAKKAAEAALARAEGDKKPAAKVTSAEVVVASTPEAVPSSAGDADENDATLALEMMENAFSILDQVMHSKDERKSTKDTNNKNNNNNEDEYKDWCKEQLPRVLVGIGDVLSFVDRHADAVDAYTRAIPHREELVQGLLASKVHDIELLKARRLLTETFVLVCEELLSCHGHDVITTETKDVLVSKDELVDYCQGYYDKARDELQEAVVLMGNLATNDEAFELEKEDVCYLATMLMAVGQNLAAIVEENNSDSKSIPQATKKRKTEPP